MKFLKTTIFFLIVSFTLFSCLQESRSQTQVQDSVKTEVLQKIEVDTLFKEYPKDFYDRLKAQGLLQLQIYDKKLDAKYSNKNIKFSKSSAYGIPKSLRDSPLRIYILRGTDIKEEMINRNVKLYISYLHRLMPNSAELRYETNFGEVKDRLDLGGVYLVIHEKRLEKSSSQTEYILAATLFTFEGNAIKYLPIKNEITDEQSEGLSVSRTFPKNQDNPNIELVYNDKTKILTYVDEEGKQERYEWKEKAFVFLD
ncbi:hypothetical protein WAF17_19335 [Bernardetia sp. ABR2-2B]|uniref:hypothetical protein n=1 Tax=Bernardetia sp. ABR2-2B TaxID=3127472 RepID=UPI0030CD9F73